MFNMPTSGPLSPIVSLERRKLEQQGIPPGQEQQGSAAKGSPISGDLAQLIQLNRMIQQQGAMQQQANAAPSTVAQDLMQRAGQQMQPQMPPQMQQMPPQPDPRQQGIAQLPQEAVGNGMAAGGIVAFDDGGSVRHFADGGLTAAEQEELDKLRNLHIANPDIGLEFGPTGGYNIPEVRAAQDQTAKRFKELVAKKQAAEQAAKAQAEAQAKAAKVSGVLSQYGIGASAALPAPASAAVAPQGDANFNMIQEAIKQQRPAAAPPVPEDVKQTIEKAKTQKPKNQGLRDLVPTLSAPKETMPSELEMALSKANFEATKTPEWYAAQRKKMEEESGLAGIWKKQQAEQDRLKAENSPEARKKAFYNNLAEQLAGQIGQRGVSTSSRLAQMVGAYGATRSTTDKETKKLEADLNKASTDLQEKQAMYRMTGTAADRDAVAKAQKERGALALEVENAKRLTEKDAADRLREDKRDKQTTRELDLRAARDKREADHQQKLLDITSDKEPLSRATSLMTSYNNEARALVDVIKAPETDPTARAQATADLADVRRRLNEVQSVLRQGLPGMSATAPAPAGGITAIPLADYLKRKS